MVQVYLIYILILVIFSCIQFEMIEQFFNAKGTRKILFYYQEPVPDTNQSRTDGGSIVIAPPVSHQKKLFITNGTCEVR